MSRRLYVGNLNFEMSDAALRETFARVGGVELAEVTLVFHHENAPARIRLALK